MNILLKYPTRGRPVQFLTTLGEWLRRAVKPSNITPLVTCDIDDPSMSPEVIEKASRLHPGLISVKCRNRTKIEACNSWVDVLSNWDVVLLISDDMFCLRDGWDQIVRATMYSNFPDTDGALWFFDNQQKRLNTLECVGRKRYERFGYLYHPSYASFFSGNEATEVGIRDGKLFYSENSICSHEHPSWGGKVERDALYFWNDRHWLADKMNYQQRKLAGFPSTA